MRTTDKAYEAAYESWTDAATEVAGRGYPPGRDELPEILRQLFDELEPDVQRAALLDTWVMVEAPLTVWDWDRWVYYFLEIGFTIDARPAREPKVVPPLYRAAIPGSECGMSWTDDLEVARTYARLRRGASIYRIEAEDAAWALIAICTPAYGRGESEYILNPDYLLDDILTVVS